MRLLFFILSAIYIGIAVGLSSGELQKHIKFNSMDSEVFTFILCIVAGVLFLTYSISNNKKNN